MTSTTNSVNVLRYGVPDPLPERMALRAGPLTALFEVGALREIALDGVTVLRSIYFALRDPEWDTIPGVISELQIDKDADAFSISFVSTHKRDPIDFSWRGHIVANAKALYFDMTGVAHTTFSRNRIGFCVLHPTSVAGQPCRVEHVDGSHEDGHFPLNIAPHQPFFNIRAVSHQITPGAWAEVRLEGETFEMEDQRNWTDDSFKTYGTPLSLPLPVQVETGTTISQRIVLLLPESPAEGHSAPATGDPHTISALIGNDPLSSLPALGLTLPNGQTLTPIERGYIKALRPAHVRSEIDLANSTPEDAAAWLQLAMREAQALDATLNLALIISDNASAELTQLLDVLPTHSAHTTHWAIHHLHEKCTSERWLTLAREKLRDWERNAQVGGGSLTNFTELNRARPAQESLDFAAYALNPQVHAFDNDTLFETLAGQAATIDSARLLYPGLPVHVGPVTLRQRHESQPDPRQKSLLNAGWTCLSIKSLAGAASATYFEAVGGHGLMENEQVFPVYHVWADIGEMHNADPAGDAAQVFPVNTTAPAEVDGFALRRGEAWRVFLINKTPAAVTVAFDHPAASETSRSAMVRFLDETTALDAMHLPEHFRAAPGAEWAGEALLLLPYAVARLDIQPGS